MTLPRIAMIHGEVGESGRFRKLGLDDNASVNVISARKVEMRVVASKK